jgi:CheY-like chemotaxis protein
MRRRILVIGQDKSLLQTRVHILNRRYTALGAVPGAALTWLKNAPFDAVVICCSLSREDAASVVRDVRNEFPSMPILALELSYGHRAHLGATATAETTEGPEVWMNALDAMLDQ